MADRVMREVSVRPGQTDWRHQRAEPHTASVTLHCQLQQGDVVAVGPGLPGEEEDEVVITDNHLSYISGGNLLELIVQPVLLNLEGDLSRICGGVEVVLAQHHQDVFVNNPPGGEDDKLATRWTK